MALGNQPAKVAITKLDDPRRTLIVQFNPTGFEESLQVNYDRLAPIGLSHRVLQYTGTDNHTIRMQLFMHANFRGDTSPSPKFDPVLPPDSDTGANVDELGNSAPVDRALARIHQARRFLLSCCYPKSHASIDSGAPPRVLIVWPEVLALTCAVTRISFKHELFRLTGKTRQMRVDLELEEARDLRLLSRDVERLGAQRSPDNLDSF